MRQAIKSFAEQTGLSFHAAASHLVLNSAIAASRLTVLCLNLFALSRDRRLYVKNPAREGVDMDMRHNAATGMILDIVNALRESGYTSLDRQAKALGLPRATAWTIVKNKHKVGRLSKKTVQRILACPEAPPAVRSVVQRYLTDN